MNHGTDRKSSLTDESFSGTSGGSATDSMSDTMRSEEFSDPLLDAGGEDTGLLNKHGYYSKPGETERTRDKEDLAVRCKYPALNYDPALDAAEKEKVAEINSVFDDVNAERINDLEGKYAQLQSNVKLGVDKKIKRNSVEGEPITAAERKRYEASEYDFQSKNTIYDKNQSDGAYSGDLNRSGFTDQPDMSQGYIYETYQDNPVYSGMFDLERGGLTTAPTKNHAVLMDNNGKPLYVPQLGFDVSVPRIYPKELYTGFVWREVEENTKPAPIKRGSTGRSSMSSSLRDLLSGGRHHVGKGKSKSLGWEKVQTWWYKDKGVFKEIKKESTYNAYKKSNEKKFQTLQQHYDARADYIANYGPYI